MDDNIGDIVTRIGQLGFSGRTASSGPLADASSGRKVLDAEFARYLNTYLLGTHLPIASIPAAHMKPSVTQYDILMSQKNSSNASYSGWIGMRDAMDDQTYSASMYVANSGAPTHTSDGGWLTLNDSAGGGTLTWASDWDISPTGTSAQVNTGTDASSGRITIRKTGLYLVHGSAAFSSLADGSLYGVAIGVDGTRTIATQATVGATSTAQATVNGLLSLTSGQYIDLQAIQNDTASEAYAVGQSWYNKIQALYVGRSS